VGQVKWESQWSIW